jgi:mevalonate kinase
VSVITSAPGSIMITGEHAVVYGRPAIVAAIEQRARVQATPLAEPELRITSEIADPFCCALGALFPSGPYRFVIAAVQLLGAGQGVQLDIRSDIDPTLGLGSSAAVTIATLAALAGHAGPQLHSQALQIIRQIQGRGSGADLAASLMGGALRYQLETERTASFAPLPSPPPLSLFNVGYKTPTAAVLARVAKARAGDPAKIDAIYERMGICAADMLEVIAANGWGATAPQLVAYQNLMAELGVSDENLDAAIARAQEKGVIGAKISGSGLGDCVLALGACPQGFTPVSLAPQGVIFHDPS